MGRVCFCSSRMRISSAWLRVAQLDAQHEAVELGLGQGERALVLDRVLGGDDQEGIGHLVGHAVDGDLALLHALEQRATASWASRG